MEYWNVEKQKFFKEYDNIFHFDILRFLVLRFCGSEQMTFSRSKNLPALAGRGLFSISCRDPEVQCYARK